MNIPKDPVFVGCGFWISTFSACAFPTGGVSIVLNADSCKLICGFCISSAVAVVEGCWGNCCWFCGCCCCAWLCCCCAIILCWWILSDMASESSPKKNLS